MSVHKIALPQKILVGPGAIDHINNVCTDLKIHGKIIILTGPHVKGVAGEYVYKILSNSNMESELYVLNAKNPIYEIENISEKLKTSSNVDCIFGVGGGKIIDMAKLLSLKNGIPYISIPTAASHDGIASPMASIKLFNGKYKPSIMASPPLAVVADSNIIIKAPYKLLASGCGDIIAKFTAIRDWRLAKKRINEYYGEYAASLALMSANLIVKHAKNIRELKEESVRTVVEALISCGVAMCIAGSSRPCSGSEHLFSHALDIIAKKPALHGEQCGVGTIIMMYLHGGNWQRIKQTLSIIGAPTTAKELGIEENEVIEAIIKAKEIRKDRYTILHEKSLGWKEAENVASITGVIKG
ncbi:MAG: NAD(P)-dependent glycerol-1-phosphate dehydrogenase [archaeon GBS-70-058]|nr:NAD(P)-dependent glycerol-1-phosphate dehydrogenase [Candidatus Culexarchaeum nevadense]